MLTSTVFGVYPYVLPSNSDPELGITLYEAAAPVYGLKVELAWWIPGMLLVTAYFVFAYRAFRGQGEDRGRWILAIADCRLRIADFGLRTEEGESSS
jgi:cytochrome bd-type quinol oxidase subunit 2